jgi:anaerobic ribonucleoside-triphosphate reductase
VGYTEDIFSALDIQDELQTLYTSGTVFHAFLGEKLNDWHAAAKLVKKIADNYKLPYYTFEPHLFHLPGARLSAGEQYTCPDCGKPRRRFTAASPATTARCRTGTTASCRNLSSAKFMLPAPALPTPRK